MFFSKTDFTVVVIVYCFVCVALDCVSIKHFETRWRKQERENFSKHMLWNSIVLLVKDLLFSSEVTGRGFDRQISIS